MESPRFITVLSKAHQWTAARAKRIHLNAQILLPYELLLCFKA
jgi:hypothetical protein